jgi:copper oxidase (laccase) domain-containing protein
MIERNEYNKLEFGDQFGIHHFGGAAKVYWTDRQHDAGFEGDRDAIAEALGRDITDIVFINATNHTNQAVIVDSLAGLDPYTEESVDGLITKSARKVLHWTIPHQPPESDPSLGVEVATYDGVILVGDELKDKLILVTGADCTAVGIRGKLKSGEPFVAGIHAGRKGTLTGVIENTSKRLQFLGIDTKEVEVFIGPAAQDIELPLELIEREAGNDTSWRSFVSEPYTTDSGIKVTYNNQLDTARRVCEQLGLDPSQLHIVDIDTVSDERTHSYRRDMSPARNSVIIGMKLAD